MTKPHLPESLGIDASGVVDLDEIDCRGCRWCSAKGACKRYPPIFRPASPARAPNGETVLAEGGWAFPPAIRKCGEFTRGELT